MLKGNVFYKNPFHEYVKNTNPFQRKVKEFSLFHFSFASVTLYKFNPICVACILFRVSVYPYFLSRLILPFYDGITSGITHFHNQFSGPFPFVIYFASFNNIFMRVYSNQAISFFDNKIDTTPVVFDNFEPRTDFSSIPSSFCNIYCNKKNMAI